MSISKKISRTYWTKRSSTYDKSPGHSEFKDIWLRLLKIAIIHRLDYNSRALDVGCGTGFIASLLSLLVPYVVCIDLSEGMLKIAKAKLKRRLNVDPIQCDCEYLPLRSRSISVVTSRHVLWALENPHKAIIEWTRVTKRPSITVIFDGIWYRPESRLRRPLRQTLNNILTGRILQALSPTWMKYVLSRRVLPIDHITLAVNIARKARLNVKLIELSRIRTLMFSTVRRISITRTKYYMLLIYKN